MSGPKVELPHAKRAEISYDSVGRAHAAQLTWHLSNVPLLPRTRNSQVIEMLKRLEDQMHSLRVDLDARIDSIAATFESRRADDEVAALAAERIRSGAVGRTEDGAEALRDLGIDLS